jgi:hypothetical protein
LRSVPTCRDLAQPDFPRKKGFSLIMKTLSNFRDRLVLRMQTYFSERISFPMCQTKWDECW